MNNSLLISVDDVKSIRPLDHNLVGDRINPYMQEAQDFDIKPFLGDALYHDVLEKRNDPDYQTLLNGGTYVNTEGNTIRLDGVKKALAYFAYSRYIPNQQINVGPFGVTRKKNEYSEPVESKEIYRQSTASRNAAETLMNDVQKYLDVNASDFKLWRAECSKKRSPSRPVITKVSKV